MSRSIFQPYATEPAAPFWGPPNSNANFCEEDYIITSYLAEFVNTLTNVSYVIYGGHGLYRLRGKSNGPFSFLGFPYWGLIAVGVLSGYFHAILKYHAQMGDDLSMLVATGFVLNRTITWDASPSARRNRSLGLLAFLTAVSVYHCIADEIVVHVVTFGAMVFFIAHKTRNLVHVRITDPVEKKQVGRMVNFGAVNDFPTQLTSKASAALGYLLWNIDMHLCPSLLSLRHRVGLPFGMLLELHGWWHILTAIGAYTFMVLVEYLTTDRELGEEKFLWPIKHMLGTSKEATKKN